MRVSEAGGTAYPVTKLDSTRRKTSHGAPFSCRTGGISSIFALRWKTVAFTSDHWIPNLSDRVPSDCWPFGLTPSILPPEIEHL
jgi:hypothetical protein